MTGEYWPNDQHVIQLLTCGQCSKLTVTVHYVNVRWTHPPYPGRSDTGVKITLLHRSTARVMRCAVKTNNRLRFNTDAVSPRLNVTSRSISQLLRLC